MGRKHHKRRYSSSDDEPERLLKRLKKAVKKNKHKKRRYRRDSSTSKSSDDYDYHRNDSDYELTDEGERQSRESEGTHNTADIVHPAAGNEEPMPKSKQSSVPTTTETENEPPSDVAGKDDASTTPKTQPSDPATSETTEKSLSTDVLNVIGKRLAAERSLAPAVHSDFALRWADIIKMGLPSEEKENLLKKYPTPGNCTFLDSPKLNEEVKHAMNDIAKSRDKRIVEKYEKSASCMAMMGKVISTILSRNSSDDVPIIEALSDISRLIADSMHDEIAIRRSLILSIINTSMRETLKSAPVDEFLFGNKLADSLKSAKLIEQSAKELKLHKTAPSINRNTKNSRGPPQSQVTKTYSLVTGGQKRPSTNYQQRSQRPRTSQPQRKGEYRTPYKKPYPARQ